MNTDGEAPRNWVRTILSGMLRIILTVIIAFILCVLISSFTLIEIPLHILLGWAPHAWSNLPPLLPFWTGILLPSACVIVAGFMAHRFILWWIQSKALATRWKPAQTITTIALLLLVSAAAIAMSGITHQFIWLMSEPWTVNRGRRAELTDAVNKGRQLMIALMEHETKHERLPDSLEQLRRDMDMPESLFWIKPGRNDPPEPFILLKPGQPLPIDPEEPVIISPAIQPDGKFVVGFSDCSVRSVTGPMLTRLIEEQFSKKSAKRSGKQ